jgi:pimeloyl-ACP methyl ester carboxylesterase
MNEIQRTHRTITTNGVNLHVVQAGPVDGDPVILLHGFPEFWYGWRGQIDPLARAGYRVIVPDQRGYNRSEKPENIASYHLDTLAQDIFGLVQKSGYERVHLVGHDWGAVVAWRLASNDPSCLKRLVILNAPHPAIMLRTLTRSGEQMIRSLYILAFQIPRLPEALMRSGNYTRLAKTLQRNAHPGAFSEADLGLYRQAWSQPGSLTSMLNWYRASFRWGLRNLWARPTPTRIETPTLVIWGAEDTALSRDMAPASTELCLDGHLALFEDAGHFIQHEKTEAVTQLLIDFLQG